MAKRSHENGDLPDLPSFWTLAAIVVALLLLMIGVAFWLSEL
jgi:hypothetical protein